MKTRTTPVGPPPPNADENLEFWQGVAEQLSSLPDSVSPMSPQPVTYAFYAIGRARFQLRASFSRRKGQLAVALLIQGEHAQAFGEILAEERQAIHEELGYEIEWKLPAGQQKSTVITSFNQDVNPEIREQWADQHGWIAARLSDFNRVFRERIQQSDPGDFVPSDSPDA